MMQEKTTVIIKPIIDKGPKVDWNGFASIDDFQRVVLEPRIRQAIAYEKDFLETALKFRCTRLYLVSWTDTQENTWFYNSMCFPFQARREAFKLAREKNEHVRIVNIKKWAVDMTDEEFDRFAMRSKNYEIAKQIRDVFRIRKGFGIL